VLNLTNNELIFRQTGEALDKAVRGAMVDASFALLDHLGLTHHDLATVSTKTNPAAAYAWLSLECTLKEPGAVFDEDFIRSTFKFYSTRPDYLAASDFYTVTLGAQGTAFEYRKSYRVALKRGLGIFLIALHCRSALTLPMSFEWPKHIIRNGLDDDIFSELLGFLRSLDPSREELPHPAFASVGTTKKRKEWFLTYGTKLLLATGWQKPSDANIKDLEAIKDAESGLGVAGEVLAYKAMIDVFRSRFQSLFEVTVDDWSELLRSPGRLQNQSNSKIRRRVESSLGNESLFDGARPDADVLAEIIGFAPSVASPDALRLRKRLPGLSLDISEFSKPWVDLQDLYMRKVKRENYKPVVAALGYLNIYLFFYLPYWFNRHPNTELKFPDIPRRLLQTIFISRLLPIEGDTPKTFIEVMDMIHASREWEQNSYYGMLKQVCAFFEFLEMHGDDLPECEGFRQPIPEYAFPQTTGKRGTDKNPIPRRLFGVFLDYVEALREHSNVVLHGALTGNLDIAELERKIARSGNLIDTFATAPMVGFIPVVFARGKTIPLRYIPNTLALDSYPTITGEIKLIPQPHALNQILVALYTGLRHNHIQWLDAETFDAAVLEEHKDYTELHVNTDKAKRAAWRPNVNFRVIEVLRGQREWRAMIRLPGFNERHHYNNNSQTKWPSILPLFSADRLGLPHPDTRYSNAWRDILCSVQGLVPELGEKSLQRLCSLEPPGVGFNDPLASSKREKYGSTCQRVCELGIKTKITPHSARVTVVSQYSTLLPAEVIGTNITGQKAGTVYHYFKLDEEQLAHQQIHQAMDMRERAYRNEFETLLGRGSKGGAVIHADRINSNLSRSLRANLQETLISYGCISLTLNEDATSGLDVLRETRAANAAENKTEICPYGNHCPPEIIKQWRGPRRCGLCQYAVRSVDHLPAVVAKCREFGELLADLTEKVEDATSSKPPRYSDLELDRLDEERGRLAEELVGWQVNEEMLNAARVRIAKGQDDRRWVVQKPEIILQDLQRVRSPSSMTAYLLARLGECISYPTTESAPIKARFDLLRRELLARTGDTRRAFDASMSPNPAAECAGLLRSLVEANDLSYGDVVDLLEGEGHLARLPITSLRLLGEVSEDD
jgi:hypothetical protein